MSKKGTKVGQWTRVTGPNLCPEYAERAKKNDGVVNSPQFKEACEKAGIEPTRRQASKFRRKMGLAYQNRNR